MHIAIVGNGIAGVTAARHIRKRDPQARISLISAESDEHWSRPALMYVYMGHMRLQDTQPYETGFWKKNRIELVRGWVDGVDVANKTLSIDARRTLHWDKLILATGSTPNKFGWPGQDLERVSGMYSQQDLQALEGWSPQIQRGCIVGGGLIGIELAEMLHTRGKGVTLLVREQQYWDNVLPTEEASMVSQVIRDEGIDLRLGSELKEIIDDGTGAVGGVVVSDGTSLDVQYVGLTAGVRPNIKLASTIEGVETARGILVDRTLRTSADDVYAVGDCAEIRTPEGERNLIQAVWYTGRMQGEVVARNVLGAVDEYDSGIWFNSAKFLDLEYQVYGEVPNAAGMAAESAPESIYWQHEDGRKAVRICHRDGAVTGFNLMGIRYRHAVCEAWIARKASVDHVLRHLHEANFDPEFSRRHESAVRAAGGAR
jgi:3-phenylpropionate/trans-cinnamate dioxygenase ferredoxin reductase subunit